MKNLVEDTTLWWWNQIQDYYAEGKSRDYSDA